MAIQIGLDINGNPTYGINFVDKTLGFKTSLLAQTSTPLTVPPGVTQALIQIQPGATVYVGPDPISGATLDWTQESADINPALRLVGNYPTLYFYSLVDCEVKVSFY